MSYKHIKVPAQGDKITVKMHPLKDGRAGGSYTLITAADGKSYE